MASAKWTAEDIAGQQGKRVLITGASSGLGLETAIVLAEKGAGIVLAVRNPAKGGEAARQIRNRVPDADLTVMTLDLADLASVSRFAEEYRGAFSRLDVLVNNAGVMMPPYQLTKDGFELQFGSNHLGHYALTGLLLPVLLQTPGSRVVTLSSIAHKGAEIHFDNLDGSKGYSALKFYGQSKLANLLFSWELDRRLKEAGADTISIGCHPGVSSTNLFAFGQSKTPWYRQVLVQLFAQPPEMGALPSLYAATHPGLKGGEYIGPAGRGGRTGYPAVDTTVRKVLSDELRNRRLWEVSEQLTGVRYDFGSR